jgi:perosamine synthetase
MPPETREAVAEALAEAAADGSWGLYCGPHLERLETRLADVLQAKAVFPCASGTLAIEIALRSLGLSAGEEVILGAYDYEPNFLTILALGLKPVLVDVGRDSPVMSVDSLADAISPATKAIVATHLHGGLVDMSRLTDFARARGIAVIEDAAQVSGATISGRPAGSWGDLGVWSFGGSKLLSAGRGGVVVTSRPEYAQRAKLALLRGVQQWGVLSELQAIVLLPQLERFAEATRHRQAMVEILRNALRDVPGLVPFRNANPDDVAAYYKLGFFYDAAEFGMSRERFVAAMRQEGIAFDPGFRPLHAGRAKSRFRQVGNLDNAARAGDQVVILHHPILSRDADAMHRIADAIRRLRIFPGSDLKGK